MRQGVMSYPILFGMVIAPSFSGVNSDLVVEAMIDKSWDDEYKVLVVDGSE